VFAVMILNLGVLTAQDYAKSVFRNEWIHHPVYGDVSFDTFIRFPNNPVYRGSPPYEWPVNGFLFRDPVSKRLYIYVGEYPANYAFDGQAPMQCTVLRSSEDGHTWENCGKVFDSEPFHFEENPSPVIHAPDVSVVYHNSIYHMVYDWANADCTWENAHNPIGFADSGIGYAWSDRPEGPFYRTEKPILHVQALEKLCGKYRRIYAATLVRRKKDWLVLAMMDSGQHFSWALVGSTAATPDGPYEPPKILLSVDSNTFYPPLLEFYPAFTHNWWVYAPATSVALNRNFQAIYRAKIEDAHTPEAWKLFQYGSVWHSEPAEHEYAGIWGQTVSGLVTPNGIFTVMFPSRDSQMMGTINLAQRKWRTPFRSKGLFASSHEGPSLLLLKRTYSEFRLSAAFSLIGSATIFWDFCAPLGPNTPKADASIHPLSFTRYKGLQLTENKLTLLQIDANGSGTTFFETVQQLPKDIRIDVLRKKGSLSLEINKQPLITEKSYPPGEGMIGMLLAPHSYLAVNSFQITGKSKPPVLKYIYTEALLGAGQDLNDWEIVSNTRFSYGIGAISKTEKARAKWNFEGRSFTLFAPKGPLFGLMDIVLDGETIATVDLFSEWEQPSEPVYTASWATPGRHALTIQNRTARLPVDSLETEY